MPHSIELKDGKLLTPFSVDDVLEAVEDYAGHEARQYIEEYVKEAEEIRLDSELDCKDMEKDMEAAADHQRAVLCGVKEELEEIESMLCEERLNRKKLRNAVNYIYRIVYGEL